MIMSALLKRSILNKSFKTKLSNRAINKHIKARHKTREKKMTKILFIRLEMQPSKQKYFKDHTFLKYTNIFQSPIVRQTFLP